MIYVKKFETNSFLFFFIFLFFIYPVKNLYQVYKQYVFKLENKFSKNACIPLFKFYICFITYFIN